MFLQIPSFELLDGKCLEALQRALSQGVTRICITEEITDSRGFHNNVNVEGRFRYFWSDFTRKSVNT